MPESAASALLLNNPFRNAPKNTNSNSSTPRRANGAKESTRTVADDMKDDDTLMARELAVLTQRLDAKSPTPTISLRGDAATTGPSTPRRGKVPLTIEIKEVHSTSTFIARKREVGLMRLSLANKEAEIRHLDEEMDRAEKRLRQQQEQLTSTQEKFNNFLKHSNLEQDAAVRRAEVESKAKQERLIDIKKLSAQIGHVEQDMRKTEVQLDLCLEYKSFMDSLTTPQWFYNVLMELRVKDISEEILRETEETYARRTEELTTAHNNALEHRAQQERERELAAERGLPLPDASGSSAAPFVAVESEAEVPLDVQFAQLHAELEQAAQQRQLDAAERFKAEMTGMTVDHVREVLDKEYAQDRIPMFFAEPDQILDIFINVEEGNLFLIQNSQELEEELERVAMDFLHEDEDMKTMVQQRHAQMESLATRIVEAQQRQRQLEERLADLESADAAVAGAAPVARRTGVLGAERNKGEVVMKQDVLKRRIEAIVGEIFRCITQHHTGTRRGNEEGIEETVARKSAPQTAAGKKGHGVTEKPKRDGRQSPTSGAGGGGGTAGAAGETGSNMGPVEMLTIIENKLDELHRYIINSENGVDDALIMSVMKVRDKERRRQARIVHLAKQSTEREERNQRALERSQAPVVRRKGKPIMWRSRPPVEVVSGNELKGTATTKEADLDEEFFR